MKSSWLIPPSLLIACSLLSTAAAREDQAPDQGRSHGPAVPVALAWQPEGGLLVALREAREIVIIDPTSWRIDTRRPLPIRPATMGVAADGRILVGGQDGDLVILDRSVMPVSSRRVGRGPVHALWLDSDRIAAASLWDPWVQILDGTTLQTRHSQQVNIEPGEILALREDLLAVADAFRGRLVILEPGKPGSERLWQVDPVNLRGIAVTPDREELLFVGMASAGPTQLTRTSIDWGQVLSSKLSAIGIDALTKGLAVDRPARSRSRPRILTLDGSKHGAADPSALAVSADGRHLYIAASGAHQILHVDRSDGGPAGPGHRPLGDTLRIRTVEVGHNPTALTIDPTGRWLISADSMSDTLSVISTQTFELALTVPLADKPAERTPAQRGEALFHDGRLALDRWITCASCHPAGHTISLNFDTLGDGTYGNPKNTPSLLGTSESRPWGWTGRFETLESQIDQSLRTSLHGPRANSEEIADIVAYLQSLDRPPGLAREPGHLLNEGRALFTERRCHECHAPPAYTTATLRDGGLTRSAARFSPPSLRAVSRSAPYFHDGRTGSLLEALQWHYPGFDAPPPAPERSALAAFLESL
jgi:hypothetical protein